MGFYKYISSGNELNWYVSTEHSEFAQKQKAAPPIDQKVNSINIKHYFRNYLILYILLGYSFVLSSLCSWQDVEIQSLTRSVLRALSSLECSSALLPSLEGCMLQHLPTCCLTVAAVKWSKAAVSSCTWTPACTQPCRWCFVCHRWASRTVSPATRCVDLAPYRT